MKRLSPATLTMAMLGVVGLLVVLYVGKKLLARDEAPPDPMVSVPMALSELEPGTRITEAHLAMGPAIRSKLSRDTVMTTRAVVGRIVKNKIPAAQPISSTDLYAPGEEPPLNLKPGMVAVELSVSQSFPAKPGQYVNVHFIPSVDPDQAETGGQIITLFKGVKVLQLSSGGSNRNSRNVKLELTPEQSSIILLAKDKGALEFVYAPEGEGNGGIAISDADRATLYEILGYTPKPPEEPEEPFVTEIFEGTGRAVNSFRDGRLETQGNVFEQDRPYSNPRRNDSFDSGSGGGSGFPSDQEAPGPSAAAPKKPLTL